MIAWRFRVTSLESLLLVGILWCQQPARSGTSCCYSTEERHMEKFLSGRARANFCYCLHVTYFHYFCYQQWAVILKKYIDDDSALETAMFWSGRKEISLWIVDPTVPWSSFLLPTQAKMSRLEIWSCHSSRNWSPEAVTISSTNFKSKRMNDKEALLIRTLKITNLVFPLVLERSGWEWRGTSVQWWNSEK